jgi:hypothetical protein
MTQEQYVALEAAVLAGAFAARQQQLSELIRANFNYPQIMDNYEKEARALIRAASAILDSKEEDGTDRRSTDYANLNRVPQ